MLEGSIKAFPDLSSLRKIELAGKHFYSLGYTESRGLHSVGNTIGINLTNYCKQVYVCASSEVGLLTNWTLQGYHTLGYCKVEDQGATLLAGTLPKLSCYNSESLRYISSISARYELPHYPGYTVSGPPGFTIEAFGLEEDIILSYQQGPWT